MSRDSPQITDALPSSKTRDRGSEEARIWQRKYELERMKVMLCYSRLSVKPILWSCGSTP